MNTENTNVALLNPAAELKAMPALPAPFDFMPKTLVEAMELAKMLSESTMVPKDYIGKAGNVFVAMQYGAELGLKPVQSLQSMAVINGKPGIYGDAGKALLMNADYKIEEWDTAVIKERGYAQCTVTKPNGEKFTRTFSIEDARRARLWEKDGPWTQYPFRQMAWRAFWFAARDAAANVLKGLPPAEELRDMQEVDVTGQGETLPREPGEQPPKEPTATEKLKQKAAGVRATTFVKDFEGATTATRVLELAAKAKEAKFTGLDHAAVGAAYKAALARVTPKPQENNASGDTAGQQPAGATGTSTEAEGKPAGVAGPSGESGPAPLTDEQIVAKLDAARNRDQLDQICADHINPLPESEDLRQKLLLSLYQKRVEALEDQNAR